MRRSHVKASCIDRWSQTHTQRHMSKPLHSPPSHASYVLNISMPSHAKLSTIRPARVVYVGVLCSSSGRVNLVGRASRPCISKHMIARKRTHAEVHDPHLPIEIIEPSVSVYARLGQLAQNKREKSKHLEPVHTILKLPTHTKPPSLHYLHHQNRNHAHTLWS